MKYDAQLGDLKNQLASAKNILVALPSTITTDKLAAALSLYLALSASGKEVYIVTEDSVRVSHSTLFGVGQISSALPKNLGGNFKITLEGVVASDGSVPSLEKLDWYPEGGNLNLVFHVVPGQTFQPARVIPQYSGGGFNMIFTVGSQSLSALGNLYNQNQQVFSGVTVVNLDNDSANTQFGQVNLVDPAASTMSEMIAQVIGGLGLNLDADTASNILTGIYEATSNLTQKTSADTFLAVGLCMQAGGKMSPQTPTNQPTLAPQQADFTPLNQVFGFPVQQEPAQPAPTAPEPQNTPSFNSVPAQPQENLAAPIQPTPTPSAEERPMGEYVGSSSPEIPSNPDPDWLTPKIYKGVN